MGGDMMGGDMTPSRRNDRVMATSRTLDGHARPDTHGIWHASQVPDTDPATYDDPQSPNQYDNCIISDQNFL